MSRFRAFSIRAAARVVLPCRATLIVALSAIAQESSSRQLGERSGDAVQGYLCR